MQSEEEKRRLRVLSQQNNAPLRVTPTTQPTQQLRVSGPSQQPQLRVTSGPKYVPIPEYQGIRARVRDIYQADSPQDIAKRQREYGVPVTYREEKIAQGERPLSNIGTQIFATPLRTVNTISSLIQQLPGTAKIIAGEVTGNRPASLRAAKELEKVQERTVAPESGLFGVGTLVPSKQALEKMTFGDVAKTSIGAGAELSSFAIGGGALPSLTRVGGKEGLRQLAGFVGKEATAGALGGAGSVITRQPEAGAKEIATGAVTGAALGVGGSVILGAGARAFNTAINNPGGRTLVKEFAQTNDQALIKDSVRELIPNLTDDELDTISSRIAKSTDEAEITNILQETAAIKLGEPVTPTPTPEAPTTPVTPPTPARPTFTADEVTNLLQGLPETTQAQFADEILNVTSPEQRQTLITRIENAKQQIRESVAGEVPEAIPVTPVQRQQEALVQAVEQPTAPTRVAPAQVTEAPTQPTPTAVQDAITVTPTTPINFKKVFKDKAEFVNDVISAVVERADNGDFDGAKRAADRLYEEPEYGANTERGKALLDIGQKINNYINKKQSTLPQITPPQSRFAIRETPVQPTPTAVQGTVDINELQKQILDPDLKNIDPIITAARNGNKEAQKQLEKFGIEWQQTTTYRFVGESEVNVLLSNQNVNSQRGMADFGIDVTISPKVTSAQKAEYRITFKESFDVNNGLGKVKLKNIEKGDHNLVQGRGYNINDVAKIEKLDRNGNVIETVFDITKIKDLPSAQAITPPRSRFAITETAEELKARLRARQAEAPIDQARISPADVAERQALSERQAFVALPTTDFVERLGELTGISPKWLRRAVDKGYGKDWVYTTALDSVQGAEDVNKVFNNRVKNIKFGVLPAEKNLSPLIGKRVTFKDGTIGKVLDTNTDSTRIQVEMPDGSVRVDVKKSDLQPRGVIEQPEPEIIKQNIPEVTDVNAPFSDTVIVDGNLVNKATGEILEPPKTALDQLKSIPTYDKATIDDFDNILRTRDSLKERFNQWGKTFSSEELDNFKEELFMISNGQFDVSEVSPRTREMYEQIKPILDELYMRSKRVLGKESPQMGRFEMYMSQQRKANGYEPQIEFGYSTIDKANTVFGSAERRMNQVPLEEVKDPLTGYLDYVDQWIYDNYNELPVASRPEYADTYIDPVNYLRDEEKIIQKLAIKSDDEIADLNKTLEPSDTLIIDDVTDNFQKYAKPEVKEAESIPINGRIPRGASLLEDRELLTGLGIYDEFGFKAYDEADITGKQIFQDDFADIANLNREQIYERLKEIYGNQFTEMPESADYLIRKRANSIFYDLNNSRKNVEIGIENEVGVPAYHFAKLEKDLAAAKIYHNIQRSVIKDEKVKKLLNKQLEKVLSNNRRIESFGEKVLNEIGTTLHTAMLGLKIPTAIQNLTETSRLWGLLDKDVLQQLLKEAGTNKLKVKETLQRIGQDKSVLKQLSDIPTNEKRITASNLLDKVRNGAMAGFDAMEAIKDVMFLRGFELQGIKKGLSGRQLGQYIAENYNKYAFKTGQFGSLGFSQNPVGRLLFQFSQYPIKQIKLNSRYAAQALSTDPAVRKEALRYLSRTFGTNAAAYAVLYPIFGWGMQRALGVDLPKFGPAVSLTVELYNIINDELERVNNENERLAEAGSDKRVGYDWENILDRWGRKVAAYPIPGGDWLFNKLGVGEFLPDGYNPFSKNTTIATWQRGYEENYKGQARIEGPQNWFDYGTQFIGGQYNTAAARGYFGNNPFSFTIDIPGTAADIRILSDERLKPLNRAEQQYFENLPTAEAKRDFITQKHKRTRLYQELKKEFGKTLDEAIFGPSYTNTATGERTVLDSSKNSQYKANLLLTVPGLLEAVNALNAENPLPIKDPFLNLIPEHQKQVLAYQALEKNDPRRNVIYSQNREWMQEFMDARDPYYAQFEIKGEEKVKRPDQFGLNPPELTENIKSLRDRFFQLDGWEARQQFLADNPSLQTYLRDKDTYDRNYNTLSYLPNVDKYPEPDAETQQYLDEYNAAGPAATEGRKAVERSAWIKANPKKWEKVQAFFTQSALWSLQNELELSVYEGIEPSEKAFERIMSIAKGMGAGQFGFGERQYIEEDAAYSRIMNNLKLVGTSNIGQFPTIPKRKRTARFRVQVPSSRRTQQIRLR